MKTLTCSLFLVPVFLFSVNANALRQASPEVDDFLVSHSADSLILIERASSPVGRVESDLRNDSTSISAKGDLYRLTQNIYAAFLLYRWGDAERSGIQHPIVIGDGDNLWHMRAYYQDALRNIPLEAVESIEVLGDSGKDFALFGLSGSTCVIKVRLKDNDLYEASSYGVLSK